MLVLEETLDQLMICLKLFFLSQIRTPSTGLIFSAEKSDAFVYMLQLDWPSLARPRKINLPKIRKADFGFQDTNEKLSTIRI